MNDLVAIKIESFFRAHKHQTYKKGEILIRADDDPSGIFYLTKGQVKEYAITKKGDELVINIFKPVSFFPMAWAINNTPNHYFYEAMTDVDLWRAPKEDAILFVKNNPDVFYNLMSRVYSGVHGILNRMTYLMAGNAYSRLITELLIYAQRFGDEKKEMIEINMTEKDLAAQSGMTRETVSREMKILKDKGLIISDENKLIIKDLQSLQEELA